MSCYFLVCSMVMELLEKKRLCVEKDEHACDLQRAAQSPLTGPSLIEEIDEEFQDDQSEKWLYSFADSVASSDMLGAGRVPESVDAKPSPPSFSGDTFEQRTPYAELVREILGSKLSYSPSFPSMSRQALTHTSLEFSPHSPGFEKDPSPLFIASDSRLPKEIDWKAIAEQNEGSAAIVG